MSAVDLSRLRSSIESSGIGKRQLARLAGVSPMTLFHLENGDDVKVSTLVSVAGVLGVTPGYLLGEGDESLARECAHLRRQLRLAGAKAQRLVTFLSHGDDITDSNNCKSNR